MRHTLSASAAVADRPARRILTVPTARATLSAAITLGVVFDSLFHDGDVGIAFPIWIGLIAINLTAVVRRDGRTVPRESALWLGTATLFACGLAWRNSTTLQPFDVVATLGCLVMAAISVRNPNAAILATRFRETVVSAIRLGLDSAYGMLPLVACEQLGPDDDGRVANRFASAARSAALGVAVLIVFGLLLRSADPIFASFVALPAFDPGDIASHALLILFGASLVGGWMRSALTTEPTRDRSLDGYGFSLGMTDVTTILGTIVALFGAFLVAQLGYFFGGDAFLHARTGLTAAQYARSGFFQMAWVAALVVPVLVITRGALRPGRDFERRHTMLALPIIALLFAIILSATARVKMYVHFYGMTVDRFYPLVFMGWLAIVLVWLVLTVLRGHGRTFAAGALVSGLATLALLNAFDPDGYVARVNVARAQHVTEALQPTLDVAHLASLRGGAVGLAVQAVLAPPAGAIDSPLRAQSDADRCVAADLLLGRFSPVSNAWKRRAKSHAAWRFWNADDAAAFAVVRRNFSAILDARHSACRASKRPNR